MSHLLSSLTRQCRLSCCSRNSSRVGQVPAPEDAHLARWLVARCCDLLQHGRVRLVARHLHRLGHRLCPVPLSLKAIPHLHPTPHLSSSIASTTSTALMWTGSTPATLRRAVSRVTRRTSRRCSAKCALRSTTRSTASSQIVSYFEVYLPFLLTSHTHVHCSRGSKPKLLLTIAAPAGESNYNNMQLNVIHNYCTHSPAHLRVRVQIRIRIRG